MTADKTHLQKILEFNSLLNSFRLVARAILVHGEERYENSMEHSYMLTMLADYIISLDNLSLNREKVMRYALIHDLIEVYAGDTPAFTKDQTLKDSKDEREVNALKRLKTEFPEYMDMWNLAEMFEQKTDDEARFVYALDKVQPGMLNYLDNGRSWKHKGVSLADVNAYKSEKIKVSPAVEKYWLELVEILEQNQTQFFDK